MTDPFDPSIAIYNEAIKVIAKAAFEVGGRAFKTISRWIDWHFEPPGRRRELVKQLLLGKGTFLFHPSTSWQPALGQDAAPRLTDGYPHDIDALSSFAPFLPKRTRIEEQFVFDAELTGASRVVCSGSPKANALVRKLLPAYVLHADYAHHQYATMLKPEDLPYCFGEDVTPSRVRVVSKMDCGVEKLKTRKFVWKREGTQRIWQPDGYEVNGWLQADFLLVSRLPRNGIGGDVLILAGGHGAGTEAIKLLLSGKMPISELHTLSEAIGDAPYYQFVLEVTKLRHTKRGTVPERAVVSEDLPPVPLNITAGSLRKKPYRHSKIHR